MAEAAARIADAVERAEKIAIFGDYDVDGATSAAVLASFLRQAGIDPLIHIPDRLFEGYGPNVEAVRALAERGATPAGHGRLRHHQHRAARRGQAARPRRGRDRPPPGRRELPPADALVNPNRLDDLSGLGHLAAVGLVFMTIVAVNRELRKRGFWYVLRPEPDLLALARPGGARHRGGRGAAERPQPRLRRQGPARDAAPRGRRPHGADGRGAPVRSARAWHLGFLLGPRINAGGRIGRADLGARLLLTDDPAEAGGMAAELDRLNGERQEIEQATIAEAEAEALAALGIEERGAVVVTAARGWHPGVVGLVAARLKERFGRPAFAIALDAGNIGTGSGRSILGVDIGRAVRRAVGDGLLLKGGGHAMAAGVTVARDRIAQFRAFLEEALSADVEAARRDEALLIDGAVTATAATPNSSRCWHARARSAPAIPSRSWRCRRTRSPTPKWWASRTCGHGCAPRTGRSSRPSPSGPRAGRSAKRCSRAVASRSMLPETCRSTAGRARSARSCSCAIWRWRKRSADAPASCVARMSEPGPRVSGRGSTSSLADARSRRWPTRDPLGSGLPAARRTRRRIALRITRASRCTKAVVDGRPRAAWLEAVEAAAAGRSRWRNPSRRSISVTDFSPSDAQDRSRLSCERAGKTLPFCSSMDRARPTARL